MQLEQVHVFESRSAAFKADKVLQENVIVRYVKRPRTGADAVEISVSEGIDDLPQRRRFSCELSRLISADDDAVLSLPTELAHVELMRRMQALPHTLDSLGLQISTGPVVPFRATAFLHTRGDASTVPLLWLQHVRRGQVSWPLGQSFRKAEHIHMQAGDKLLVAVGNYVLLRRFSAKEEERRLTAAPLFAADWTAPLLGLENHLNYIHRPGNELSAHEARGLAAFLNSRVIDDYFRVASGNTQVSATEIRALPLPSRQFIERLGRAATRGHEGDNRVELMIEQLLDGVTRASRRARVKLERGSAGE
jgi:adenine-specific DNA-methyltransferase